MKDLKEIAERIRSVYMDLEDLAPIAREELIDIHIGLTSIIKKADK
jgi:hypothetical protein